jgi:acyl-CoA synthetase (AMP-forming)/AMP-acid ligase II
LRSVNVKPDARLAQPHHFAEEILVNATEPLRRAARRWPDREAVRDVDHALTFRELEARVNRVARLLGRLGVERGDRVATSVPNSVAHVVAQLAIVRAGAVWVAINRRLAPPEVAYMLEHSEARVLLTDASAPPPSAQRLEVLDVSGGDAALERRLAAERDDDPMTALGEDDVARLRYTSGTTGKPKAAALTHGSALTSLRNLLAELHELSAADVVLHVTPLTHASEALLAPAFWRGARTLIAASADTSELAATIVRERVTMLFLVPTMIAALVDAVGGAPNALPSLRTVVYGAAPIAPEPLARALVCLGPVLLQIYGMSECPFPITTLRKADHLDPRRHGSCGAPTAMNDVEILDRDGRALPVGEVGQIAVRGPQMMREYWRDPEATAAALVGGWLRSGDLGRFDADGFLTLVDRIDDVIISGGFNVYPREVELALAQHAAVAEVGVAAVPHPRWGQGVGAWVVLRKDARATAAELIDFCRARLASYKKPVEVRFVAELPHNSTGKLLRRRLRQPE